MARASHVVNDTVTAAKRSVVAEPDGSTGDARSARQRLLDAADELFYAEGVHSVGIDRIIEHAGVAKASLYNTFGSKEALVCAYLEARHQRITGRLVAMLESTEGARKRLLGVFDVQAQLFTEPRFRGCAFVTATAEAPAGGSIEKAADSFRAWIRNMFLELAVEAGAEDPPELARQLHLIYDGASLAARMDRTTASAGSARRAAASLVDAATVSRS